jgi:hypothetical protein
MCESLTRERHGGDQGGKKKKARHQQHQSQDVLRPRRAAAPVLHHLRLPKFNHKSATETKRRGALCFLLLPPLSYPEPGLASCLSISSYPTSRRQLLRCCVDFCMCWSDRHAAVERRANGDGWWVLWGVLYGEDLTSLSAFISLARSKVNFTRHVRLLAPGAHALPWSTVRLVVAFFASLDLSPRWIHPRRSFYPLLSVIRRSWLSEVSRAQVQSAIDARRLPAPDNDIMRVPAGCSVIELW